MEQKAIFTCMRRQYSHTVSNSFLFVATCLQLGEGRHMFPTIMGEKLEMSCLCLEQSRD